MSSRVAMDSAVLENRLATAGKIVLDRAASIRAGMDIATQGAANPTATAGIVRVHVATSRVAVTACAMALVAKAHAIVQAIAPERVA